MVAVVRYFVNDDENETVFATALIKFKTINCDFSDVLIGRTPGLELNNIAIPVDGKIAKLEPI
jgi:hypothetical protein